MIHRDITASNVVIASDNPLRLELIDLAFSKSYRVQDPTTGKKVHLTAGKTTTLWGTPMFASINAESFQIQSRRDDLEAAAYVLLWLRRRGHLPWDDLDSTEYRIRCKKFFKIGAIEPVYGHYLDACWGLGFEENPQYGEWIHNFTQLRERLKPQL